MIVTHNFDLLLCFQVTWQSNIYSAAYTKVSLWKLYLPILSNMEATNHMWLLSSWNVLVWIETGFKYTIYTRFNALMKKKKKEKISFGCLRFNRIYQLCLFLFLCFLIWTLENLKLQMWFAFLACIISVV